MITISHTHVDGTTATGTSKGDGAGDVLSANGFRWRYGAWRVLGSRDRVASWRIDAAAAALRAAGFEVTVSVDDTPRPFAEAESERAERADGRADRYAGYAGNAAGRANAADSRFRSIADGIPLGQPILVGHHSEGRHRRDLRRMDQAVTTAAAESRKAGYWEGRADAAENWQRRRENVPRTLRRIERLEVERRQIVRALVGKAEDHPYRVRVAPRLAQLVDEIAYWRRHVAEAEAAGVKVWGPSDFAVGDWAGGPFGWMPVIRVNAKTLTVPCPINVRLHGVEKAVDMAKRREPGATRTAPYDTVSGRRSAAEMAGGDA